LVIAFAVGSRKNDQGDRRFHRPARAAGAINAGIEMLGNPRSMLVFGDVIFARSSARSLNKA
jgi:hypothetical protein